MINTPILFLIFNRPEYTQRVFQTIREQQPKQLFIAADGPRKDFPLDRELCFRTRQIINEIDWECDLKTNFQELNLGCKKAVSGAISWFFENVEEGIILEDDCLPDPTFFQFCELLLAKYRFESKVMSISGSNLLNKPARNGTESYYLAHGGIWGWATWRRAWELYDIEMKGWQEEQIKNSIKKNLTKRGFNYYNDMFDNTFKGSLNTWDVQWFYTILKNNGLSINPSVNLVKNIGFGADGTHTFSENKEMMDLNSSPINFPLTHPLKLEMNLDYVNKLYKHVSPKEDFIGLQALRNVYHKIKSLKG